MVPGGQATCSPRPQEVAHADAVSRHLHQPTRSVLSGRVEPPRARGAV